MRMTKLVPSKQFVIVLAAAALAGLSFMPLAGGFPAYQSPVNQNAKRDITGVRRDANACADAIAICPIRIAIWQDAI